MESLDKLGMSLIEAHDPKAFHEYLNKTENTICGRHPIAVFMNAVKTYAQTSSLGDKLKTKFVKYAQSNQAKRKQDSSVSYASSLTYLTP